MTRTTGYYPVIHKDDQKAKRVAYYKERNGGSWVMMDPQSVLVGTVIKEEDLTYIGGRHPVCPEWGDKIK